MEKKEKSKLNRISIIAVISLIIAGLSAFYSCQSFHYTKILNQAAVSVKKTSISFTKSNKILDIDFSIIMENTGNEYLNIDNIASIIIDANKGETVKTDIHRAILNTIYPDVEFTQFFRYTITLTEPSLSVEEIINQLKENVELYMVVRVDFSNNRISEYDVFYFKYAGSTDLKFASLIDYEKIKSKLPNKFLICEK